MMATIGYHEFFRANCDITGVQLDIGYHEQWSEMRIEIDDHEFYMSPGKAREMAVALVDAAMAFEAYEGPKFPASDQTA